MAPIPSISPMAESSAGSPIPLLTRDQLLSDLAILRSNPALLDDFLPSNLRHGTQTDASLPKAVTLDKYSPNTATKEDSVAQSLAFTAQAKAVLALKSSLNAGDNEQGGKGTSHGLHIELERIRREAAALAERLQAALEGR